MDNASLSSALVYISFASSSVRRRTCSCGLFSALPMIGDSGVGKTGVSVAVVVVVVDAFSVSNDLNMIVAVSYV